MKLLLVCLVIIAAARPGTSGTSRRGLDVFEFGENVGHVSYTASGSISGYEKAKKVHIVIPECEDLRYVKVNINNKYEPPAVTLDWGTRIVTLQYGQYDESESQYKITAKTTPSTSLDCNFLKSSNKH